MFEFMPVAEPVTLTPAPLQQVIVQVKFDGQASLAQHAGANAIHDLLGNDYPRLLSESATTVTAGPVGVSTTEAPQWRLTDFAGEWSCVIAAESVALQTSAYTRWEEMRRRLLAMLDALSSAASPRTRERVGLRYVNHIPADENGSFANRVRAELLGLGSLPGWRESLGLSLNQNVLREDRVQLAVRHGFGAGVLAPDGVYLLDVDCACEVPELFDTDATLHLLDDLNDAAWRCFNALIHPDYRAWMEAQR